jgi:hypothetical protein
LSSGPEAVSAAGSSKLRPSSSRPSAGSSPESQKAEQTAPRRQTSRTGGGRRYIPCGTGLQHRGGTRGARGVTDRWSHDLATAWRGPNWRGLIDAGARLTLPACRASRRVERALDTRILGRRPSCFRSSARKRHAPAPSSWSQRGWLDAASRRRWFDCGRRPRPRRLEPQRSSPASEFEPSDADDICSWSWIHRAIVCRHRDNTGAWPSSECIRAAVTRSDRRSNSPTCSCRGHRLRPGHGGPSCT